MTWPLLPEGAAVCRWVRPFQKKKIVVFRMDVYSYSWRFLCFDPHCIFSSLENRFQFFAATCQREEMAVAELLANSSRVLPEDLRVTSGERRGSGINPSAGMSGVRPRSAGSAGGAGGLRITNPDLLSPGPSAIAHTPWDGEVRAPSHLLLLCFVYCFVQAVSKRMLS